MTDAAYAAWSLASASHRRGVRTLAIALMVAVAAAFVFALAALSAPTYPELSGRITDQAGLLTPEDKVAIEAELSSLEATSTDQLAVVTVQSLEGYPIEDYGIGLARKWGIGQKGKDNGVLLIVAPNDRKVRIEVGRRLEPMMTDTMSSLIIQNAILPKFRRGDFAGGIKDGVRDIKTVLLGDADEVKRRAAGARSPDDDPTVMLHLLVFLLIFAFIVWTNYRNARAMGAGDMQGTRRRGGAIFIPGGWSGGGGGGGGWSGGGGGFGGGGASGGW